MPYCTMIAYSDALFVSLFWLLHATFSLYIYFKLYAGILYNKLKIKLIATDAAVLKTEKHKLTKIPDHIAFIVLEEFISYPDLARLVIWSIAMDIQHISLYDTHGQLKRNQDRLLKEIHMKQGELLGDKKFRVHWRPHVESLMGSGQRLVTVNGEGMVYPDMNGNGTVNMGNGKNGNAHGKEDEVIINISLLSREDGIPDIARAAGAVCQKVYRGDLSPTDVSSEVLVKNMATNKNMPDPSLLVRLGITRSNVGFLPWQIRLTEIHSIKSHICVTSDDLIAVLRKFSRCDQRFGK